jgi:NAD(P)-dependent dehydrogenase (short-subunit alcohol dehydrogenase family)
MSRTSAPFHPRPAGVSALVTGGGGDIARAIAGQLVSTGLPVALADARLAAAQQTASLYRASEVRVESYELDVTSESDVARVVAAAETDLGPIGVLINTAGILQHNAPVRDLPLEEWQRVLAVNLTGCFLTIRATLPSMKQLGWGRIVSLASSLAVHTRPNVAAYASSKAALLGLTRSVALEFAGQGITANAVLPALTDTAMPRQHWTDTQMAQRASATPMGRLGHPEDMAAAVAYLVSEPAEYVTGVALSVAGGTYIPS